MVNIIDQEGLGPDTARGNAGLFVLIDDLLGECGLGETLERHLYRGRFALGGKVEAVGVDEGDRLLVGEDGSAGVVQVLCSFCSEQIAGDNSIMGWKVITNRAEDRSAAQVLSCRLSGRAGAVHLGTEGLVLGQGDITVTQKFILLVPIFTHSPSIYSGSRTAHSRRAAVGSSRGSAIGRLEWNRAFGVKLRASDNISGRVEVLQATDKQVSVWSLKVGLFGIGNERAPQKDTVCPYKRRADNGTTYAVRVTTHKLQV